MKLNPSEFMEHAPQELGAQIHVNHEGCSAGLDRKKRLYIKRLPDATVLAYCHHCGLSGSYKSKNTNIHLKKKSQAITKNAKDLRLPTDIEATSSKWPHYARAWLVKYGITESEVKQHGIVFSPKFDRLLFPLYMDGDYIGWQGRSFNDDEKIPKYLTTVDRERLTGNCGLYKCKTGSDTVVLVEDCLSAIKVSRGESTICLLGSHPTPEVINWIASRYNNIYIWLDNDKPEVIKQQNKLKSLFEVLVTGEVKLILTNKDPKEFSTEEIEELLK